MKCDIVESIKYQEVGDFKCQKCPSPTLNILRVSSVGIAVFIYFMLIIIVNVRKTKDNSVSILLRILTNYAQIITSTLSFSSSHPEVLTGALVPFQNVGDSSTAFLSFDCFITDYEIKGKFPSNSFLKLFLLIFLPLILFLIVAGIWILLYLIKRSWIPDIKRFMVISFVSILFLIHPLLARSGIDVFR